MRVQTGSNRCKWVRMGVGGCVGTWGTRGTTKTRQEETKMAVNHMVWVIWPGKFPRTSCFAKKNEKKCMDDSGWVRMVQMRAAG